VITGDGSFTKIRRLVQGSALDRLLSDRALRSRLGSKLAKSDVRDALELDAQKALAELDTSFKKNSLPSALAWPLPALKVSLSRPSSG